MAGFDKFTTTNKGLALLGKAQTGVELRFTQMKVGDGTLSGQAIPTMNDLISPKMVIDLNKLKFLGEGKAVVGGLLSNSELATGFYFREWGVFALDPDEGEIMFCYANAGAAADYIPPGGSSAYEQQLNAVTIIGAAQNVSAEIVSGIYATAEDLEDHVKDKNNPHGVTPEQIGAETPAGAQAKADAAEASAKAYTDTVAAALQSNLNNHIGQGGTAHATATTTQAGFMSASDKAKLDGIQPGAQVNTVTSVAGKTGAVTLTKSDVGLGNVPNYPAASQAQAEAGTDNATLMTPLRTAQAIAAKTGGIQFRINNGVLEYNDGGVWKPVGGGIYTVSDNVLESNATERSTNSGNLGPMLVYKFMPRYNGEVRVKAKVKSSASNTNATLWVLVPIFSITSSSSELATAIDADSSQTPLGTSIDYSKIGRRLKSVSTNQTSYQEIIMHINVRQGIPVFLALGSDHSSVTAYVSDIRICGTITN